MGERLIGVPIENLAEVCVVPEVSKLMAPEGVLVGAFDLRGSLVPLLDLEVLSGVADGRHQVSKAAVLQYKDRVAAIPLDEIVTLTDAEPIATRAGNVDDVGPGAQLFPGGFVKDGRVVSCLNAHALFGRREALSIASTRTHMRPRDIGQRKKYLIFRSGGAQFGVDTSHVWATIPTKPLDTKGVVGSGGTCIGFIDHHGWRIPIIQTNRALGLGQPTEVTETEIVVLRVDGERLLGLSVEATERISAVSDADLQGTNALVGRIELLPRLHVSPDGVQTFMIDVPALIAREDLGSLADLSGRMTGSDQRSDAEAPDEDGARRESEQYLVFDAGVRRAVRADQVSRILKMPDRIVDAQDAPPGVIGFFTVGASSVPLITMDKTGTASRGASYVLLITVPDGAVGFAVDDICSMQTSEWRIPDDGRRGMRSDLIRISDKCTSTFLPVADLSELAVRYLRRIEGAPA